MNKTQKAVDKWFRIFKESQLQEMCPSCGAQHQMGGCSPQPDETEIGDRRRVVPHDQEGRMAKRQLFNTIENAQIVMESLHDDDELETWVQSKLTKISSMMGAVKNYIEYEYNNNPMGEEE
jgi:methionyl-tRNA synthetase